MSTENPRPGGVTAVAITLWVSGALNVITGVLLLFQTGNEDLVQRIGGGGPLIVFAVAIAILGAVTLIVAGGLFGGSYGARVVATVFQCLSIVAAIVLSITAPWLLWLAVISILLSITALVLLYLRRSNAFFRN
ncbi:hypothetical protein ASC66_10225 [Leifsonia sp. Root4]|uniref:hypothetical protein n=1 Tax=Leifsonia sp. Root4 TaxID=1736525 RepID=UPI0006F274B8|nr:hypothetical protein [Leifsonia sp. Root4]KQW05386.1 hypothetical protein ASC66_10225 [Leifsonia sp. Root4]